MLRSVPRRTAAVALLLTCVLGAWRAERAAPASAPPPSRVLVVGDSLAVGMRPYLGGMLTGSTVVWDARSGRTTPQGMQRLRLQLRRGRPDVVAISLGTNDGPDPARFASRIHRVLAAIPRTACIVWADINRPPRKGPFRALNRVLRAIASEDGRMRIVSWDRAVVHHRVVLPDDLHPDPPGFRLRSRLYASAVARGCSAVVDASRG